MSVVTTILIATSAGERGGVSFIEAALGTPRGWWWLEEVGRHAGGDKVAEADVYMGAINHLDLDQFKAHMRAAPWEMPEAVMLLVNEDGEDGFQVEEWRLAGA